MESFSYLCYGYSVAPKNFLAWIGAWRLALGGVGGAVR